MEAGGKVTYRVGDLLVDPGRGQVTRDGKEVPLPRLSFDLFVALVRAAPNLVTPDELMAQVWPGLVVTPETVSQRVKLLRQSLNDDPRQPRYVAGVRGRGYRIAAPVEVVNGARSLPSTDFAQPETTAGGSIRVDSVRGPAPARSARRPHMALVAVVGVAAVLALAGLAVRVRQASDGHATQSSAVDQRPVLAVLPFAALGGSDDHLSLPDGLQTDILTEVSRSSALDVIAATSVEQFRGTTLSARDIGERLGATHLLEGGVQRVGDHVRINAQLIDVPTQSHVWAATYDRELTPSNLFAVQREITDEVTQALQVVLASDRTSDGRRPLPTTSIDAWALEKAARVQLERRTTDSMQAAERLFRKAIALDPRFARAYAGLADAVWLRADQEGLPWIPAASEAERLVNLALRLDGDIPEAWATRAKLAQERKDYATAEAAYRRAFELNPSYARAHSWYSQFMYQIGRERESREAARRAAELDPLSAPLLVNMGLAVADPLDPTEGLAWMDKARAADPSHPSWARGRALVHAYAGQFDAALHWDLTVLELDPDSSWATLGVAIWHLQLDDLEGARTWLAEATREGREPAGAFGYESMLHLYAGETETALATARRALASYASDGNAYMVLDAVLLGRGAVEAVIATVRENFPELSGPEELSVGRPSLVPATDLALALRLSGDVTGSNDMLDAVTRYLDAPRREGSAEFAMHEVRVAAIRGDRAATLQLLESLTDRGWPREHWRYYRDHDPAFDLMRSDPRFRRFFAAVEDDVRARRLRAAKSGDLGRAPPGTATPFDGDHRSVPPRLVRRP
jgi:TolB-like protein/DNA-binding winged helix-turn-helix (wHTH) protein/tetratricopeptide (TPR) repeat protein